MTSKDLVRSLDATDTNSTEPTLMISSGVASLFAVVWFILHQFVPSIPEETLNQWTVGLTPFVVIIVGFIIRNKVWSPYSVQKVVDQSVTNALRESNTELPKRDPKRGEDYF